jgi:HEPN domain-containing protein
MSLEKRKNWIEIAKRWLKVAEQDFREAEDRLKAGVYTEACFHSHQASEKIIKAFLYSKGEVVIGHNLEELLQKLREYGIKVSDLVDDAKKLNPHYTATRYPNAMIEYGLSFDDYTKELAEECLRGMKNIWRRVREALILE